MSSCGSSALVDVGISLAWTQVLVQAGVGDSIAWYRQRALFMASVQGIRDLHEADMSNEEKAATAVAFYKKGRAVTRSPTRVHRHRRNGGEVAVGLDEVRPRVSGRVQGRAVPLHDSEEVVQNGDQGRAGLDQPWGMQSPGQPRLASQVGPHMCNKL